MFDAHKNILVFDTATMACSVALKTPKGNFSRHKEEANIHSQALLSMIDELLKEASISLQDVDYLAVGIGPGSFTGLRIGIGVAQGLAYSNGITLIPISTLEMIAVNVVNSLALNSQVDDKRSIFPEVIAVAHDARMSEVYSAFYAVETGKRLGGVGEVLLSLPENVVIPNGGVYLCGNAWLEYAGKFEGLSLSCSLEGVSFFPDAEKIIDYIADHLSVFTTVEWDGLAPMYVRNDVAKKPKVK